MSVVPASRRLLALGTTALVAVTDPDALGLAHAILVRELEAIDQSCSRFRADSELARVNAVSGEEVRVSPLLFEALETAHGGVAMTASDVAFAAAGTNSAYTGRVVSLAGNRVAAQLTNASGAHADLTLDLRIDGSTDAVSGSLHGTAAR